MTDDSGHLPDGGYEEATVSVENVGGIDRCDVSFRSGITVLSGRNATNRTSLLRAIADVLGGSPATLKSDAERGTIELRLDDETYTREYDRSDGRLSSSGEQFTDQRDLVDLFVRLLEDNPTRRAVERDDDLRDLIMKPVDTDQIQRDIGERERERSRIDDRLREIERDQDRLPTLESKRGELREKLGDLESDISDLQESIDEYEVDQGEAERAESLLSELEALREDRRGIEAKIQQHDQRLEELRDERESVADDLDEVSVPEAELETVESNRDRLQRERRELEDAIDDLTRIVRFNEDLLEGDAADVPDIEVGGDVAANLDPTSKTVECWTCGSEVQRGAIADRLDELRSVVRERRAERDEIDEQIQDHRERLEELRERRDRNERLETRLEEIDDEIAVRERQKETLEERRESVGEEISDLETRVDETEELRDSDLVEMYQTLNELEYERGRVERELDDVEEDISEIEARADERERLQTERGELTDEIRSLRSRIEDLEREAVEQFNAHMENLLEALDYENVERVWIERKEGPGSTDDGATFDLHVVRQTSEGSVYEDTVDTLSESEREVIGLVVALAGYLIHEVYLEVPFILLDSLEAVDAQRIESIVDYFAEYTEFLVVALLPEDADALSDSYERVTATVLSA